MLNHAFEYLVVMSDPRGLGEAARLVAERLPLTNFVRRLGHGNAGTFRMPSASLIGTAHAENNPLADPTKIDTVIGRCLRFKHMTEMVGQGFWVTPIFVWQPIPLYKYDPKLRVFPVTDEHGRHEFGYPAMEQAVAQREMGRNFVWCADAFNKATEPMYIDAVHYSIAGNETVATCIAQAIVDRGLITEALRKVPSTREQVEPVTTAENGAQPDALAGFRSSRHATITPVGAPDGQQEYFLAAAGKNSGHYVSAELFGIAPGTYTLSVDVRPEVASGLRTHLLDSARSGAAIDFRLGKGETVTLPIREGMFVPESQEAVLSSGKVELQSNGWLKLSARVSVQAPRAQLHLCLLDRHGGAAFRPTGEANADPGAPAHEGRGDPAPTPT
jgi:hypothetical protein